MPFLRWLVGFIVLFGLIVVLLSIGGSLINILLLFAAIVFVADVRSSKRRNM
ncbi:hypothetical protein [Clostridium sp.]|uniref:hypothetical protein n=1 Tax=Clostridium sp. TaxID=1506 RepID=UPI001A59421E|nr:hypothetical protein [Clostridium sp.]MBK5236423.1 hypothetical protein [Clostridium sp.]